jgi:hypothetical protein
MEKIPPLYNRMGRVNDPDIAKSMAENEDLYHREDAQEIRDRYSSKSDQEYKQMIDEEVEGTGKTERALKNLPILIEKIRTALSTEELEMFRTAAHAYKTEYRADNQFEEILKKIIKE